MKKLLTITLIISIFFLFTSCEEKELILKENSNINEIIFTEPEVINIDSDCNGDCGDDDLTPSEPEDSGDDDGNIDISYFIG